jgi:hypothetical protein
MEMKYGVQDGAYIVEKKEDLSTDVNGMAYFFPDFLVNSTISYSSRVIGAGVDAYVSANSHIDLCKNNIMDGFNVTDEDLINMKNSGKIKYISYRNFIRIDFNNNLQGTNFWFYLYPKVKRDYIYRRGNAYILHSKPVIVNFSYKFDKEEVDDFVTSKRISFDKCENPLTYLDKQGFDYKLKKIENEIKDINHSISILYAEKARNFDELNQFVQTLSNLNGSSTFKSNVSAMKRELEGALKRQKTTENFCNYIENLVRSPEYKNGLNRPISIKNSCPNEIEEKDRDFTRYIKFYILGYKISGEFIQLKKKTYIKDTAGDFYEFTKEDGCNIFPHKIKDDQLITLLSTTPSQGYFATTYDWDNDANLKFDCLKIINDRAYKFEEADEATSFALKLVQFPIQKFHNFFVFKKNENVSSSSSTPSSSSSSSIQQQQNESSSSSWTNEADSSNSGGISSAGCLIPDAPCSSSGAPSSASSSIENSSSNSSYADSSSSNTSSQQDDVSTSSQSSSSDLQDADENSSTGTREVPAKYQEIFRAVAGKTKKIDGYFIRYGNGAFDWLYVNRETKEVFKLEGVKEYNGEFVLEWDKNISDYLKAEKNGEAFTFERK